MKSVVVDGRNLSVYDVDPVFILRIWEGAAPDIDETVVELSECNIEEALAFVRSGRYASAERVEVSCKFEDGAGNATAVLLCILQRTGQYGAMRLPGPARASDQFAKYLFTDFTEAKDKGNT